MRLSESEVEAPAAKQCATKTCFFAGSNAFSIFSTAARMQAPAPRSVSSPKKSRIWAFSKYGSGKICMLPISTGVNASLSSVMI